MVRAPHLVNILNIIIRRELLLGFNGAVGTVSYMAPFFNSMKVLG